VIEYLLADVTNIPRWYMYVLAFLAGLKAGDWVAFWLVWWIWRRHDGE
jgi:hypothetical protein